MSWPRTRTPIPVELVRYLVAHPGHELVLRYDVNRAGVVLDVQPSGALLPAWWSAELVVERTDERGETWRDVTGVDGENPREALAHLARELERPEPDVGELDGPPPDGGDGP